MLDLDLNFKGLGGMPDMHMPGVKVPDVNLQSFKL